MILSDIRFLIGVHLGQKGLPPTIIAPVLNILAGIDNEMELTGWDITSPEIHKEIQRLKEAIVLWNAPTDDEKILLEEFVNQATPESISELLKEDDTDDDDETSWLDEEDE